MPDGMPPSKSWLDIAYNWLRRGLSLGDTATTAILYDIDERVAALEAAQKLATERRLNQLDARAARIIEKLDRRLGE